MSEQKDKVSSKWKKEYTVMLLANLAYIVVFYLIMIFYS